MCRYQHIRYTCGCTSPQPIYTGCPPDRCRGPYTDRSPKRMGHPCAACAHRSQSQRHAPLFDDGSNAARRESVRRWETTHSSGRRPSTSRQPTRLTNLINAAFGSDRPPLRRSRSVSVSRRPQMTYRTRSPSPPPFRRGGSRRRNPSAEDEILRYSSEENEYTIRYNRGSGEWSSVQSPRRRRRHRDRW